jgi:hypothetical protein
VTALSGDDINITTEIFERRDYYIYNNTANPDEHYITIYTTGTKWLKSVVTFRPANIPDAPTMVVDTSDPAVILLPRSVDEWEIKYYRRFWPLDAPNEKYLKNACVVNIRMIAESYITGRVILELSDGQYFTSMQVSRVCCYIPEVVS